MSKSKRGLKRRRQRETLYLSSRREQGKLPRYSDWPVVRAYVPLADAWQASGFGTAGIVRQQPDGKVAYSLFDFSLLDHGLKAMFGKHDLTLEELDAFLPSMKDLMPRMVPGSVDDVSRFVWGAYGLSLEAGFEWPEEELKRHLKMVPPLSGTARWWAQQFRQLAPAELIAVIDTLPDDSDVPSDKELVIVGTITFELDHHAEAAAKLEARGPEFQCSGSEGDKLFFGYSRAYPKNHWSPLRLLGGRQSLGTVTIEPRRLTATTNTLSMMSILVAKLKDSFGDDLRFHHGKWIDPTKAFPVIDEEDEGLALPG